MKKFISLLVFTTLFAACSSDDNAPGAPEIKEIPLNETEKEMAEVSPNFAVDLLLAVDATIENNEKFVVSPLSASMALSMAMNGAQGETYDQMAQALSFGDYSLDEINSYNNKLLTGLAALENQAQISIANSLWLNEGFHTLAPYNNTVAKYYGATSETLELSSDYARNRINEWCKSNTNGLIPNFLEENLSSDCRLAIIDALHFKCPWLQKFDKKKTKKDKFYAYDGTEQEVEFMDIDEYVTPYMIKQGHGYQLYSLYFGKNKAFCMDFIVTYEKNELSVEECLNSLDNGNLAYIYNDESYKKERQNVCFRIPKFKIDFKEDLKDALHSMGIEDAFTSEADFSKMAEINPDEYLYINRVQQANVFSIDEAGGEGASVTDVEIEVGTMNGQFNGKRYCIINRPFLFFVRENKTNTILFAGKVSKM